MTTTCIITLKITFNPAVEGEPQYWDWDALLDTRSVEVLGYTPTTRRYDVLSPDGLSIHHEDTYPTRAAAESALREWVKRFEFQGFYSTARRERIPLDELPGRCRIVEATPDDDEED